MELEQEKLKKEADALIAVIEALKGISDGARQRILAAAAVYLAVPPEE